MSTKSSNSVDSQEAPPRGSRIVRLALIGEGLLALISVPWFFGEPERACFGWGAQELLWGIFGAVPLLLASFSLSMLTERTAMLRRSLFGRRLLEFQEKYVRPLCLALSPSQAFIVGIASGLGEELFFRGLLTWCFLLLLPAELGILAINVIFAAVHFIGKLRHFAPLLLLYTVAGLYFSLLTQWSGSILTAIVCHALFNFVSIVANARLSPQKEPSEPTL